MKKRKYLISSLMTAGFLPVNSADASSVVVPQPNLENLNNEFTERLKLEHKYTLAGHRSHASHSSHASHRSSSSGGFTSSKPVAPVQPRSNSTSPRTVLPSLPNAQKAVPLPGNSDKFKLIVMRVQLALISYGYYNGQLDGIIGKQSSAALSRFQSDHGLSITGTVTPEVLDAFGITVQ